MGQKKIILDTNILISALGYTGNEREILKLCAKNELILYISPEILHEISRVLDYPKFHFTQTEKDNLKLLLTETGRMLSDTPKLNIVRADPSDNIFLEAALAANADFLITGDKHLLKIKQIGRTQILRASDFLKTLVL